MAISHSKIKKSESTTFKTLNLEEDFEDLINNNPPEISVWKKNPEYVEYIKYLYSRGYKTGKSMHKIFKLKGINITPAVMNSKFYFMKQSGELK